jgi:fructosamine-3-kinase
VHGDLWNGNVLCGEDERVWLIDPAAYRGDAEVDLAMTEMFGGFPTQFYAAYRACRPEPPNWTQKKRIYNLYHYLNHLNLFGHAYLGGCEAGFAVLEKI